MNETDPGAGSGLCRGFITFLAILGMVAALSVTAGSQTLKVHPDNPRIFEYKGEPVILRTFGEHYGSVINPDFDYVPYLETLHRDGMNLTRVVLVGFHPATADLNDTFNPSLDRFLQPWPRKPSAGNALDGRGKWDLSAWNEAYFTRLRDFVQACSERGVIVELTLFSTIYSEDQWAISPFNPANNAQGIGPSTGTNSRYDAMRPVDAGLLAAQQSVVRRIVREMNGYDNVYFGIQNEPFWNQPDVADAAEVTFHNTMLAAIRNEESTLPKRHLVAHNFPQRIATLNDDYDIINAHYPFAVPSTPIIGGENLLRDFYSRNRPLAIDENATAGPIEGRLEAWMFLMGGGAVYNALDQGSSVYSVSDPAGMNAPGPAIRANLRNLGSYLDAMDLIAMRRDLSWITSGAHPAAKKQGMSKPGQQYAAYFYHGSFSVPYQTVFSPIDASNHTVNLVVSLPAGSYRAVWTRPSDMTTLRQETFSHGGGGFQLQPVTYQEDVALRIDRTGSGDTTAPPPPGGLVAAVNPEDRILLNWSAAPAADLASYRIYRSSGNATPDFSGPPLAGIGSGTTTFIDTTALPGLNHRYVVAAVDTQGNESRHSRIATAIAPGSLDPPVAHAGADRFLVDADLNLSENVALDGGASLPGDRPIVSYSWRVAGVQIATGANPVVIIAAGITDIDLLVTDDVGLTATDTVRISIANSGFINGSFENSLTGAFAPGVHGMLLEGLAGWTLQGESNALTSYPGHPATEGNTVLVFNGGGKGAGSAITQTFPTVAGRVYQVDFSLGVVAYNTLQQRLTAQVKGTALQPLLTFNQNGNISGNNMGNVVWTNRAFSFVADSSVTSLTLRDASPDTGGLDLVLDNVSVHAQQERVLTLGSEPSNGVMMAISPADLDAAGGGSTPLLRNFANGTSVTVTPPPLSGGQGFRGWRLDGADIGNNNPLTITMNSDMVLTAVYGTGPPVILTHPAGNETDSGQPASFIVAAAGTGTLTYQWRFNGSPITGATEPTHHIPNVSGLSAGHYDVIVTGDGGATTSLPALLAVRLPDFPNGSFEDGFNGWLVTGNTFLLGPYPGYAASDQSHLIVFNGGNSPANGSLAHTFQTVAGATYRISFAAGVVSFMNFQQILRVEVQGDSLLLATNRTFTGTGSGVAAWQPCSETFVAESATTTVRFVDLSATTASIDLLLDHVRIAAASPAQFVAPVIPLPAIRIERLGGQCRILMTASVAGSYLVESSDDLTDWKVVGERTADGAGEVEIIDAAASGAKKFYRASARP